MLELNMPSDLQRRAWCNLLWLRLTHRLFNSHRALKPQAGNRKPTLWVWCNLQSWILIHGGDLAACETIPIPRSPKNGIQGMH